MAYDIKLNGTIKGTTMNSIKGTDKGNIYTLEQFKPNHLIASIDVDIDQASVVIAMIQQWVESKAIEQTKVD